jgi:hypothetical protein
MPESEDERVSEAAQLIAGLVSDPALFSVDAATDLRRLIGHTLAEPPMAARRWDSLSVLVTLIYERAGLLPTVRDYENERRRREASAPAASTLVKRYGTWMGALSAATRLIRLDGSKPAWSERKARYRVAYRPGEIATAIARFYRAFGCWPTALEYGEWARISRRASRACGAPDPRFPGRATVIRRYGTFDRALEAAKAMYGEAK